MRIEQVTVGADGGMPIPAALREELGIRAGDALVLESDGDSLLVRRYDRILAESQDDIRPPVLPDA